jgi:AcrR family transcriptional regulator
MSQTDATVQADRPLRADARRNRQRILDAALAAFAQAGAGAQMDDIAAAAGVGVGTVYRHFPTKDALVHHLIRAKFERFCAIARETLADESIAPGEQLSAYMWATAETSAGDVGMQHVFQQAADPELGMVLAQETGLFELCDELIRRGREAGTVRADFIPVDIGMSMCAVAAVIGGEGHGWDWRRHLALVLDGIRPR